MKKFIKYTTLFLSLIIVVAVIFVVALMTFVSPNRFKPMLTEQVKKSTGRDLVIDGDLSWTFFPSVGVKVGHVVLNNPTEFKQKTFAEMDSATIAVKLMPLLHSQIESTGITLKGLKLYLIKNANGKTNWEDLQAAPAVLVAPTPPIEASTTHGHKASFGLAISAVTISDASVSWINEQAKQYLDMDHFNLTIKNVNLNNPMPLTTSFHFSGKKPDIAGNISLKSEVLLHIDDSRYSLDHIDFDAKVQQGAKKWDVNVKGQLVANLADETIQFKPLNVEWANLKMAGELLVKNFSQPKTTGHFVIQPFDVKKWLVATGQDVANVQTLKDLQGEFDLVIPAGASPQLTGQFKIDEVLVAKVKASHVAVKTQLQNGVLDLAPITAQFYQGTINGQAKINLTTTTPQIAAQMTLTNVQAEPLMTDLGSSEQKFKIVGAGNVNVKATTAGTNSEAIIKNLNGTAQLRFNNGILKGIDVAYLLSSAGSLVGREAPSGEDTHQTPFGTLTATATIQNGVLANQDLLLDSTKFDSKGNGTIDLANQQINYQLQTTAKQNDEQRGDNIGNFFHLPVPILVKGSLNNPSIRLDTQTLVKAVAERQIKKMQGDTRNKIQDQIKERLPEQAKQLIDGFLVR